MNERVKTAGRLLAIGIVAALAVGCTHVKPYQREQQARIQQQAVDRGSALDEYEGHLWSVREGAAGGNGEAGGGCGCN